MNSKLKKAVSTVSALTIAVSAFSVPAITASAATEVDYIGTSSAAETFDSYDSSGWAVGTDSGYFKLEVQAADDGVTYSSGNVLSLQSRGTGGNTASYAISPVSSGSVVFEGAVGGYALNGTANHWYDGGSIAFLNSEGSAVLSVAFQGNASAKPVNVTGTTTVSSALTVMTRPADVGAFDVKVDAEVDLDANTATVGLEYGGNSETITVDVADSEIAALRLNIAGRSSTTEKTTIDNVKFYSLRDVSTEGGTKHTIAPADRSFGFAALKDGAVDTEQAYAYGYAQTETADGSSAAEPVELFKDTELTGEAAESISIPFAAIPGDAREIKLYTGIELPENLTNGLQQPKAVIDGVKIYSSEFLNYSDEDKETEKRTSLYIDEQTPFATITFNSSTDDKGVTTYTATVKTLDDTVIADQPTAAGETLTFSLGPATKAAVKDATSLFVYNDGTGASGAYGDITVNFAPPQRAEFAIDMTTVPAGNVYLLGKVNAEDLVSFKLGLSSDGDAALNIYAVSEPAADPAKATFADTDRISAKDIAVIKDESSKTVTVTGSNDRPYVYAVLAPADKVTASITSAAANYSKEPGTNKDAAKEYLETEYLIANTHLHLVITEVEDIDKTALLTAYTDITAAENENTAPLYETYANEISYIDQTLKGLDVKEAIDSEIKPIYDAITAAETEDAKYAAARQNRETINSVNSDYKALLIAGMRCVDNYDILSEVVKYLNGKDAATAAEYKAAVDAVANVTGFVTNGAFSAEAANAATSYIALEEAIAKVADLAAAYDGYDAAARAAIDEALGGLKIADINSALEEKVQGFKDETETVFEKTFEEKVAPAFEADGADSAAKSAALKIDGINDVFQKIEGSKRHGDTLKTAINDPNGDYDKYAAYYKDLEAYNIARQFLADEAKLEEDITNAGGTNVDTYEALANEYNDVKQLLDNYDKLTAEGAVVDEATKAEVDAKRDYMHDAETFLTNAVEEITKWAQQTIVLAHEKMTSSTTRASYMKYAEFEYNQLSGKTNSLAYLAAKKAPEQETATYKNWYDEIIGTFYSEDPDKGILGRNKKTISDLIALYDEEYDAYVAGLDYTAEVTAIPVYDGDGNQIDTKYGTEEYGDITTYSANKGSGDAYLDKYRYNLDYADDMIRIINSTKVTVKDEGKRGTKDGYSVSKAAESQERKTVDAKFEIQDKLRTIFEFNAARTPVIGAGAQTVIALVYETETYADFAEYTTAADFAEAVAAAYDAGKIAYTSELLEKTDSTTTDTVNAYTKARSAYVNAYDAYKAMFEQSLEEGEAGYDDTADRSAEVEEIRVADLLAEAIMNKLDTEKEKDEGIENARRAKEEAGRAEADEVMAIINELYDNAVNKGYSNSAAVKADSDTFDAVVERIAKDTADTAKDYTDGETNYFSVYYSAKNKLATVEAALDYWTIATELYEKAAEGAAEAALVKNEDGTYSYNSDKYDEAYNQYNTYLEDEPQKADYFNKVAANNGNADIIADENAVIDAYNSVIDNYANPVVKLPTPASILEYKTNVEAVENIDAYLAAIAADDADDAQKAELALVNSEFSEVTDIYASKKAVYETIKPAAEFTDTVNSIANLDAEEKLEAVKKAIEQFNAMSNNASRDSLGYISESTVIMYNNYVDEYRSQLVDNFTEAYNNVEKGSFENPMSGEAWEKSIEDALNAYALMVADDQKLCEDKKAELEGLKAANEQYAANKAEADALIAKANALKDAYEKGDKDDDTAIAEAQAIIAECDAFIGKIGAAAETYLADSKAAMNELITNAENSKTAEKLAADYDAAVDAIDLDNITIDSYPTVKAAEDAFRAAKDAGLVTTDDPGYGVIGAAWDKFSALDTVKAVDEAAETVKEQIDALPDAADVTAEDADAINAAKAAYDELTATDYGKAKAEEAMVDADKLDAVIKALDAVLNPTLEYDFNSDGEVDVFDLGIALKYSIGITKGLSDAQLKALEVLDSNDDGKVSLVELKAVVNAFTD